MWVTKSEDPCTSQYYSSSSQLTNLSTYWSTTTCIAGGGILSVCVFVLFFSFLEVNLKYHFAFYQGSKIFCHSGPLLCHGYPHITFFSHTQPSPTLHKHSLLEKKKEKEKKERSLRRVISFLQVYCFPSINIAEYILKSDVTCS